MSQNQMRLNQSLREDHLLALIAKSVVSLGAVTRGTKKVWGQHPRKIFDSVHFTLAQNASLNTMLVISDKDIEKFCCVVSIQEASFKIS